MKECFECGQIATEDHHVIPQSLGGTKTVPLCGGCHDRVHGWGNKRRDFHKELTIEGLKRAKERGVVLGNRTNIGDAQAKGRASSVKKADEFALSIYALIEHLLQSCTQLEITDFLNNEGVATMQGGKWHQTTITRLLKRVDSLNNSL